MALQDSLLPQKQLKLAAVPVQNDDQVQNDQPIVGDDNIWDLRDEKDVDAARIQAFLDAALEDAKNDKS